MGRFSGWTFILACWVTGSTLAFLVEVVGAQQPRSWNPPHYPTPTEQLPPTLPHTGFVPIRLRGSLLNADPVIGRPTKLLVQGRYLWTNDQLGDPYMHVFDLRSGELQKVIGRAGEGPGDFRSVVQLSVRPGDQDAVWAYDFNLRRLTRVMLRAVPGQPPRTVAGPSPGTGLRMLWLDASRLLVVGRSDTNRIMIADSLGRVRSVMTGPILGSAEVTTEVREAASSGVLVCTRPGSGAFAISYTRASRVDLFESNGRWLRKANTPIPNRNEGDFFRDARGKWRNPAPREYYRGCAATASRLYLLFSGRLDSAGPEGTRKWDARFVHVFDWNGEFKSVFELDRFAEGIGVDGDSVLYAGGGAMEGIYRYKLP